MQRKLFVLFAGLVLFSLMLSPIGPAGAQGPLPPQPPTPEPPFPPGGEGGRPGEPVQNPDGLWYMPEGARPPMEAQGIGPLATGGSDDFGYTWDDSVAFNWIDATSGTDTGMSGLSHDQKVGPIPLPFSFKFYENTYTSLYIAASGYLGFTDYGFWPSQGWIPSTSTPNNVIAPYWTTIYLESAGPTGRAYYASGGSAPNHYFVVEWYDVKGGPPPDTISADETYHFEVVLYENGDIVFQYHTMTYNGSSYCGAAGIEDSTGLDGLAYSSYCQQYASSKAVRFYRPAPSARVRLNPLYQGRFTRAGETVPFQVPIRNTGDRGADTYDITTASTWPVSLYAADGTTALTDTDDNGTVDTGSVAQGSTVNVVVKVQTPGAASVGDDNTAAITVRSSLDTNKSKTATLQTAVPAPFAQVYWDNADGAMSLYLVQPNSQTVKKATGDYYYGYDMAVAEMPGSFAYFWTKYRSVGSVYVREIEYILLDRYGETVRAVSPLTYHSGATMETYDDSPAVAVASNGRIGVLWYRELSNPSTGQFNYNIWFAILDASGSVVIPPTNLTNNNAWGTWKDLNVPSFYDPRIAATGDNRFVLAWQRAHQESGGEVDDIYYAIRDTNGGAIKEVTKFTNGVAGGAYYYSPALAALAGKRALLAYDGPSGISYAVLDSAGNIVKAEISTGISGEGLDAVQLSDGKIVVAWSEWGDKVVIIKFTVLDGNNYNVVAGPTALNNPAASTGDAVSIAADSAGHAVLTWMDMDWSYRRNLYYALVDGSGTVLTAPMIFRTSQAASPHIETSDAGYGNTSYSPLRIFLPLIMR